MCHIGTYAELGVKNGLKDVARVLELPFNESNAITKKIDEITDEEPGIKFKDLDDMQYSVNPRDQKGYEEFKALEKKYSEIFRLARTFEGSKRNMGIHASGILVTSMPVNDIVPTRKAKDGTRVSLYTGPELEDIKLIKLDLLGLRTVSVIRKTIESIDENMTMQDLYDKVDMEDPNMYEMIQDNEVEGLFQIESNLFKGIIKEMKPNCFEDIVALTSLGRPGPLSAGMPDAYNKRKHELEEAVEPLPNTLDIVESSHSTIIYQEHCMLIAKRVAGYDDNQADSYFRKILAKGHKEKLAMCRQWFVYGKVNRPAPENHNPEDMAQPMYDATAKFGAPINGGITNGYDENQLNDFFDKMEGYASYLFNRSHKMSVA